MNQLLIEDAKNSADRECVVCKWTNSRVCLNQKQLVSELGQKKKSKWI